MYKNYRYFLSIIVLSQVFLSSNSFGFTEKDFVLQKKLSEDLYCNQLDSLNEVVIRNGFLPNSWDIKTGKPRISKGADEMVQPRMLQYGLNAIRINALAGSSNILCGANTFETIFKSTKAFSNNFSVPIPWKKTLQWADKTDEPMNIYDIGDWLSIVSTLYSAASDKNEKQELHKYLEKINNFIFKIFTFEGRVSSNLSLRGLKIDSFSYGWVPRDDKQEIGHLTLFIDGLLHSYHATKNQRILRLAERLYPKLLARGNKLISEVGDIRNGYSTIMTYGELMETTNLFHGVTGQKKYLLFGKKLALNMLRHFSDRNGSLFYRLDNGQLNPCLDSMGLEAATYGVLFFLENEKFDLEREKVIDNLKLFLSDGEKAHFVSRSFCSETGYEDAFFLGQQYGLLKTLFYLLETKQLLDISLTKQIDVYGRLNSILTKLISLRGNYGIPNSLEDYGSGVIADPGGNVWLLNEALTPIIYHLNNNSQIFDISARDELTFDFRGCNFLLISTVK